MERGAGAEGSAPRQGMFAFTGLKVGVGNINLKRKVFILRLFAQQVVEQMGKKVQRRAIEAVIMVPKIRTVCKSEKKDADLAKENFHNEQIKT